MIAQAHPFELAGMGFGPYRFLCIVQMPNLSEDSAANFGNANPYAEVQAMKMKEGAGTCACCGMAITVIQDCRARFMTAHFMAGTLMPNANGEELPTISTP